MAKKKVHKKATDPKIIGHALRNAWRNTNNNKELELIVSGTDRTRDVLSAMISPYARISHVIESAGIISFKTDYEYANAMLDAWLGEKNSLSRTYKSTFKSITGIEPSMKLRHCSKNDFMKQDGAMPSRSDMWNLEMIGAYDAHGVSQGQGASVAVIDTGADYAHDEISHAFGSNKGVNIVTGTNDIYDRHGHGTHVSGTIAGKDTGVAPLARLYAVKVFEDDYAYTSDVIAGIDWSIREGVNVINMSLGGPTPSPAMQAIIDVAVEKGIYVVAAAGNEGRGPSYPASCEEVVSVAALDATKKHAYFSNIYHTNDISAPGVDILSCVPGGYRTASGTSMASPHTAGGLALLVSHKKRDDYEGIIKENAEKLADVPGEKYEDVYGAGLLRVDESLEYPATMAKILFSTKNVIKSIGKVIF
ncbi:MAG: S8 family peptidase [Candidatus Woesearchaeota archaeon]